ncbi:E3 ubiquitin-protein ligase UBR1 [Condylostylus longicornis]|uniref:E3 ubiquitin-protein ligase UBR1 n=1 Tax=Condylostylus longicornis TaxID=2530218 RepID=UPI00244DD3DF|nr:E3 ubiquitin-protein ligase UBR1 [Condylostylus longicornis]XP_055371505.1 E3 ubiquitin-protein ligase UBR1 [Condylostylus longicornis]
MSIFEDSENQPRDLDEKPLKEWRAIFESGGLATSHVINFFKYAAPNYFQLEESNDFVKTTFNERCARTGIIDVLEEFILGDNPQKILEKLKEEGNASSVCGRVFKVGEPTYTCRECGMDTTCVLCVNCFKQSAHRFHKYKMSHSGGGGCCDCGDEEAWKKDYYCEEHAKGKESESSDSTLITSRMKERCEIAFRAILMYSIQFLEIESHASLVCLDDDQSQDVFCTILYNDESHTFEQVISTLVKYVNIDQKDAMEIVTSIDREGRAVVKCGTFDACKTLKEAIEKQHLPMSTGMAKAPLKVSLLHKKAYSCQQFALQLLTWFQDFLTRHKTFREIFAAVANDKRARPYNIAHILEYDCKLWKTARSCWHRLLISGMLMEYENKKILAIEFSRHYATIFQDFILDDHDHSFSIVSLSVQLFTVPTIAHYLMANEGVFHKLLHTFYWECIEKNVEEKTLKLARNTANMNKFKRASFMLYDLKYILSFKPDIWTPDIREGFLEGVKVLLKLLHVMQGMDAITRQTGQHMDYEPEWESAFNLHIKLASVISLVLEWLSADQESLVKAYGMIMKLLLENKFIISEAVYEEQKVAGHAAQCIMYDVASKNVSIHLPLSRFFSGLYLLLGQYGLNFDNVTASAKRTPEEIMEPILCAQTMIAQVHSGMWRRNGYSLLHQLYFYRNVRCRLEMLDRDIAGLQIGAALIESNQYLIHILNKFGLIAWAQPEFEPNDTNTNDDDFIRLLNMIDEFLELLIVIIGERYVPGIANVTEDDRTKKEIIQQLCIKKYSHSELNRQLPDSNNETVLEDVIDSIAIFQKPTNPETKGVYKLKEEFYEDYNMFFYHYTKEEKSRSEETQRLRRKQKGELVCCPPPKLPKLCDGFVSIANLLQSDVMLSLMQIVLSRGLDLKARSFTESHLQKILYLIGYGLLEEQSQNYPFLSFYERASKYEILQLLEKLVHSPRVEAHRDFIIWTIKKFKELQPKENKTENENNEQMESEDSSINQPMTAAETEKQEKEERARLAAKRRAKIMAQMQNAQKNFMKSNAELFATTSTSESDPMDCEFNSIPNLENSNDAEMLNLQASVSSTACLGVNRKLGQPEEQKFKCILCFEDCVVSKENPCLVYSAFIQKSRVLSNIGYIENKDNNISKQPGRSDDSSNVGGSSSSGSNNTYGSNSVDDTSPHTGTCGHVMHASCWNQYYENEVSKENRRPNRTRSPNNLIMDKKEFLCPYCRCLSNAIIPLTPPMQQFYEPKILRNDRDILTFGKWIEIMQTYVSELNAMEKKYFTENREFIDIDEILKKCNVSVEEWQTKCFSPVKKSEITPQWEFFTETFMTSIQRVSPFPHASEECERYLVTWNSCAYTIRSLEMYLRAINKPFKIEEMSIRHKSVLDGLVRVCGMLGAILTSADKLLIHLRGLWETALKSAGPSVLEWDPFSLMTNLIFMSSSVMYSYQDSYVIPSGNFFEYYCLKLMFAANLAKALILFDEDSMDDDMDLDYVDDEPKINLTQDQIHNITRIYKKYNLKYRHILAQQEEKREKPNSVIEKDEESQDKDMMSPIPVEEAQIINSELTEKTCKRLIEFMKQESDTFLRCSVLLFHFMTDVEFPEEFSDLMTNQYDIMCKYLGLDPSIENYFKTDCDSMQALESFCMHPDIIHYDTQTGTKRNGNNFEIIPCNTPISQLVDLPDDYSDLINSILDYTCPNNDKEDTKYPTMCLVCGKIMCGQSYCCQPEIQPKQPVGACTYHAYHCGAGIGLFLRIRDCQILYLGVNKGCFIPPPYLDEYGETDQGLRRGNPLRLCRERYKKLHLTWLGHGLHEEVSRLNEITNASAAAQWQHM